MKQNKPIFIFITFLSLSQETYAMFKKAPQKRQLYRSASEKKDTLSRSISSTNKRPSGVILKKSKSDESYSFTKKATDTRLANITEEHSLDLLIPITPETINNTYAHGDTLLIWAANNNQISLVKKLMSYDSLRINKKNDYDETALHYCARHKNKKIIKCLLNDPRTDASITNNEHRTARDVIEGNDEEDIELRRMIFARIMLDLTVNKIRKSIQQNYFQQWMEPTDCETEQEKIIQLAVTDTQTALNTDQDNQEEESRILPDSAKIPTYANDDFITKMFSYRLNGYK